MQITDMNGVPITDGDLVNVFFTSPDGEGKFNHDCVYRVERGCLGDMQLKFERLLWESHGYNQYPIHTRLCLGYGTLIAQQVDRDHALLQVPGVYATESMTGSRWVTVFQSDYFVKMDEPDKARGE